MNIHWLLRLTYWVRHPPSPGRIALIAGVIVLCLILVGVEQGGVLARRLLAEEYDNLRRASDRDVHDDSKGTTLPVAREIAETYVLDQVKTPWYIDLLNINLNNHDLALAKERIQLYMTALKDESPRITENLDF